MKMIIDGIDFHELEPQRYYAPPNSWSPEKRKDVATSRIFSGDWWGALKRDGAFYKFIKDENGEMELLGRSKSVTGDYLNKIDWVPHLHDFFESLPNGACLIGELYFPSNEQAKTTTSIMNCLVNKAIKRQEKEPLHYYIFDVLAWEGRSWINKPAIERFDELNAFWRAYPYENVEWAQYFCGKELWEALQSYLADGHEGVVITRDLAPYQPGKRPSKDCLKVKKELQDTIDCIIIGINPPTRLYTGKEIESWPYWFDELKLKKVLSTDYEKENHKPIYAAYVDGAPVTPVTKNWFYNRAGSFKLGVYKDGKIVEIGNLSGITDEMKENWRDYKDKVCEVTAMEIIDGTMGLRHPKLVRVRDDIDPRECTWEKIYG